MNAPKFFRIFISILTVTTVLGIGGFLYYNLSYMDAKVSTAYELELQEEEVSVSIKDTYQMTYELQVIDEAMVKRADKQFRESFFSFSVVDDSVLSVSSEGLITPKKEGETDVILTFSDLQKTFHVVCFIPLESLSLTEHQIDMIVGDKYSFQLIASPDNHSKAVEPDFTSKDPTVVYVNDDGSITALSPGTTTIWMAFEEFSDAAVVNVTAPLKSISFEKKTYEIEKNKELPLKITYDPANTTDDKTPTYTLLTSELGTLSEGGLFTPEHTGKAQIKVAVGEHVAYCDVNIIAHLEGISFPYSELTLKNGDSVTIPVAYDPYDTTDELNFKFESSNTKVATVNNEGFIQAVGPGSTKIKATCQDFSCEMTIHVVIPVTGVQISASSLSIEKGTQKTISASVVPENTTEERYIDWASNNARVATVENGTITAVGPGTCTIMAYHDDFVATCEVTVYAPLKAIHFTQDLITLLEGDETTVGVTYDPVDTTDSTETHYASSNESIARVEGNRVIAVSEGTCTVTAYCGPCTTTVTVKVNPYIEVDSISLNKTSVSFGTMGDTESLTATVSPENATDAAVSFSSSDNTVATVDGNGKIRAVGSGDCVITASSGGKAATVEVHVSAPKLVIVLDPGHDESHTGAFYYDIEEHIINLKVALHCKEYLESHYSGVAVYLTRSTASCMLGGTTGCLSARATYAQSKNADVFISFHFNACTNHGASGAQCFTQSNLNGHDWIYEQSDRLGDCITSEICAKTGLNNRGNFVTTGIIDPSTGQITDYYAVLRHTANMGIPGVIIEHCFMDNVNDVKFAQSEDWLKVFGEADAIGIARYLGLSAG